MHALALVFLLSAAADQPSAPAAEAQPTAPPASPPAAPAAAGADKPASAPAKAPDPFPNIVPWFVPRTATIGFFLSPSSSSWTPSAFFRVGWEVGVLERPRNHLVVIVDVGSASALSTPLLMRTLYQHVAVVGLGYRSTHTLFHWGFHITAGPIWYRASYALSTRCPGSPACLENRVLGWTEGRAQIGIKLAPNFLVGVAVGMGTPWVIDYSGRNPGNAYLGGLSLSLWADWR